MAHAPSALRKAFSEVAAKPPAILAQTRKKKGAAQAGKQRVAIALNKARSSGAKIPYAEIKKGRPT